MAGILLVVQVQGTAEPPRTQRKRRELIRGSALPPRSCASALKFFAR